MKLLADRQTFALPHGDGIITIMFRDDDAAGIMNNVIADNVGKCGLAYLRMSSAHIE